MESILPALELVQLVVDRLSRPLNEQQTACVTSASQHPLLIIAGPGTGKTRVMVLRALRHLLVVGIPAESIVIATFTKKAVEYVRARWLDWALPLVQGAKQHPSLQDEGIQAWLECIDLNRCVTKTFDDMEMLGEYQPAGTVNPVRIEGYPANQTLLRSATSRASTTTSQ